MINIADAMREGAERVLERLRHQLDEEQAIERAALADAVLHKAPLAAPYWQGRFKAEQRVRAAEAVIVAISEVAP